MSAARRALAGLLLFVPFQPLAERLVSARPYLGTAVRWVDEVTLILLVPWAVRVRLRAARASFPGERAVWIALVAFGVSCLASALLNSVGVLPAVLGTFDYVKGVLCLLVFAALGADRAWLRSVYRWLLAVALAGALCAVAQEIVWKLSDAPAERRLGLLRVPGFFDHPNALGLYLLLFFLVEAARARRPWCPLGLYVGLALSVSRMVHTAAAVLLLPLVRRRRWLLLPLMVSGAVALALTPFTAREYAWPQGPAGEQQRERASYRAYAFDKGVEVWRDHPVLGAGPGRFGGVVSVTTGSPLYERYPWRAKWLEYLQRLRSLDQFPPQLIAELGAVGAALFVCLYLTIIRSLWVARDAGQLGRGLLLAALVVPFYAFGSGLHLAYYMVTVAGLAGAHLGLDAAGDGQ